MDYKCVSYSYTLSLRFKSDPASKFELFSKLANMRHFIYNISFSLSLVPCHVVSLSPPITIYHCAPLHISLLPSLYTTVHQSISLLLSVNESVFFHLLKIEVHLHFNQILLTFSVPFFENVNGIFFFLSNNKSQCQG